MCSFRGPCANRGSGTQPASSDDGRYSLGRGPVGGRLRRVELPSPAGSFRRSGACPSPVVRRAGVAPAAQGLGYLPAQVSLPRIASRPGCLV